MSSQQPVGVYLAVPFCKAKCSFCNFASDAFAPQRMDAYVDRLCEEIRGARQKALKMKAMLPERADSVYFGGGTPSLLQPGHFSLLFEALRNTFDITRDAEITLECAPGQLPEETLEALLGHGVNRVSLGVQSFVDREAAAVGRLHTGPQCEQEIARLIAAGVDRVCLDLIAGLPHQTETSWRESIARAVASGAGHVSVYMLEVDEDSRLGREVLTGGVRYGARDVPDEDAAAAYYELGCVMLESAGIRQYEISNFAGSGQESKHNVKYWRRRPYIGFGLDAHSMLATDHGAVRFQSTDDMEQYMSDQKPLQLLQPVSAAEPDFIGEEAAFEESLFLGLRMNEGVELQTLNADLLQKVMPALREAREAGLVVFGEDRVQLTARGRMASNEVFSRLLIPAMA